MKPKILLIAAAVLAVGGLIGAWSNQRAAIMKRDAILASDQASKSTGSQIAELREYATYHMNASVSFELGASYKRAVEAAQAPVNQGSSNIYTQAEAACVNVKANSVSHAKCVADYVAGNTKPGENPKPPQMPNEGDYIYQIYSPKWAPDLAGLALLLSIVLIVSAGWVKWVLK